MTSDPEDAEVNGKRYKINTDFRIALRCNEISENNDIMDEERGLAIVYLLFGDEGINNIEDSNELLEIALKFLSCGQKKEKDNKKEEVDMDFEQDWNYIQTSFFSDYNIDLTKSQIHWWKFCNMLGGLTDKCIFNRVRFVRNFDISQIKDSKEREKWIKQKELVALKREKTSEEKRLDEIFERQLKGD